MYKPLNKTNLLLSDLPRSTLTGQTIYELLNKFNGANPYNVLLISATLTALSVVITWGIELLANEILLQY